MFKQTMIAAFTLTLLTGCGATNMPLAATAQSASLDAQGKKKDAADRPVQSFNRLVGLLHVEFESKTTGEVSFQFGTKGLLSGAKNTSPTPRLTVDGKAFKAYGLMLPGADGKLYFRTGPVTAFEYYLLGSYEIPANRANIKDFQECAIKFDMLQAFTFKRPGMASIGSDLVIDLKSEPKLVETAPQVLTTR